MTQPNSSNRPPVRFRADPIKDTLQDRFKRQPLESLREFESRLPMLPFTKKLDTAIQAWDELACSISNVRKKYTMADGDLFPPSSGLSVALFLSNLEIQVECVAGIDMIGAMHKHAPPHLFIVASVSHFFYMLFRHAWSENFEHENIHMKEVYSALRNCAIANPVPMEHVFYRPYVVQIFPNKPSSGEVLRLLSIIGQLSPYTIAARGAQGYFRCVSFVTPYSHFFGVDTRIERYRSDLAGEVTSRNGALSTPPELDYWKFPFFPVAVFPGEYNLVEVLDFQSDDTDPRILRGILTNANDWLSLE